MMSIDSLLELIVERDSEITGRQIAEALWFMLAIKHSQESEADARGQLSVPSTTRVVPPLPSTIQQSEQPLPLMGQEETRSTPTINQPDLPDTISASEQSQADLYPLSAETSKETAAKITPLRIPSVGALPNAASIARALRPLRRRVPSRHRIRLDEKLTAERSAEENTLVPVMLPAQSRWLALHLVIDQGGSSMIWQDTIQELHRLLIRQGAFRDVRLWQFDSDSNDKELMLFAGRTSTIPRRASELSDPEGRHLILIVSDCVGRAWHDGRATTTLSLWSNSSPMAVFQLMPPQLWDRTALGREIEVRLKASAAGIPNTRLIATSVDAWEDVLPTKKVLTPVVTLTTEAIKAWVNLLIGRPGSIVSGHAFARVTKASHQNRPADLTPSPSQRVQRFLSLSTPTAQRLALLTSAAPITLPILNLLCATFLPMAGQSHVAEVLLSGLLYRTSSAGSREPDTVLYEFYDGVRELLLELAPLNQSSEVVARVSAYLEERAEHGREMRALLVLPDHFDVSSLPEALSFARIRATLLRRMGYMHLARLVEQKTRHPTKVVPHKRDAVLRHARYYVQRCASAEQHYRDGRQEDGLALFDQERPQFDAAWTWLAGQPPSSQTDELILDYTDATASIGEIRYRLREERVPRLETQLAAARRLGQVRAEGQALGNLALTLAYLGDYERAIDLYHQRITLARAIGDRRGEGVALANLGSAYKDRGQYQEALRCHHQALEITRELGDRRGEGAQYGNLGNIYQIIGHSEQAIAHLDQHLAIARSVGDRRGEGNALSNLALAYNSCRDYQQGIACAVEALDVLRGIRDRRAEGNTLTNLGSAYLGLGDYSHAITCFEQQLAIAQEISDLRGSSAALGSMGVAYKRLGNVARAIESYEQALAIDRQIGERSAEAIDSWNLGLLYEQQGDLHRAIECIQVYVDFAQSVNHPDAERDARWLEVLRRRLHEAALEE